MTESSIKQLLFSQNKTERSKNLVFPNQKQALIDTVPNLSMSTFHKLKRNVNRGQELQPVVLHSVTNIFFLAQLGVNFYSFHIISADLST